eukprot:3664254-Rhodomonas_salina.3
MVHTTAPRYVSREQLHLPTTRYVHSNYTLPLCLRTPHLTHPPLPLSLPASLPPCLVRPRLLFLRPHRTAALASQRARGEGRLVKRRSNGMPALLHTLCQYRASRSARLGR